MAEILKWIAGAIVCIMIGSMMRRAYYHEPRDPKWASLLWAVFVGAVCWWAIDTYAGSHYF
jgi:hypothetical protein